MLLIHVAVAFLTLTCAISKQNEFFDSRNITSLIIIDDDEPSLNITERKLQCQKYGLKLPSIENDATNLMSALGYWKASGFLMENNMTVFAIPSIEDQKVMLLDATSFIKKQNIKDKLVCSRSSSSPQSSESIIPITLIIIGLSFFLIMIIVICYILIFPVRNLVKNDTPRPSYFTRLYWV